MAMGARRAGRLAPIMQAATFYNKHGLIGCVLTTTIAGVVCGVGLPP